MLPYQELELRMLQYVMGQSGRAWVPTPLPQLAAAVNDGWPEVIVRCKNDIQKSSLTGLWEPLFLASIV